MTRKLMRASELSGQSASVRENSYADFQMYSSVSKMETRNLNEIVYSYLAVLYCKTAKLDPLIGPVFTKFQIALYYRHPFFT